MNVLVVPMFALSRMGGPWSRAQAIAAALEQAGHRVTLGVANDGNCVNPCVANTVQLPVPSPLGLPMTIASRTFPIAEKLGISGRKPVRSFEEVLWLTGALSCDYERESVSVLCETIEAHQIDAVYAEYSLPAIIVARALGVPAFGSFSFTTQTSYANNPRKASGLRKLLDELDMPGVESSLELFDWLDRRFVSSCVELEPIQDDCTEFVGFLKQPPVISDCKRDCILVYLGAGSVPQGKLEQIVVDAFREYDGEVLVAGCDKERKEGNVRFARRFNFSELLPRAECFVHHGGQNSTMDALAYATPQVIVPGRVFERQYNAQSITQAGAGATLDSFNVDALKSAVRQVVNDPSSKAATLELRRKLAEGGGANAIVSSVLSAIS